MLRRRLIRRARAHAGVGVVAALTLVCAAADLARPPSAQAAFPGRNGVITYVFGCVHTLRPDGTPRYLPATCEHAPFVGPKVWPVEEAWAGSPTWTTSGKRLLFLFHRQSTFKDGHIESDQSLALTDASGAARTAIPLGSDSAPSDPAMGPDGRHFTYIHELPNNGRFARADIRVASLDGSEDRRLRPGCLASWSPDGRTIAYVAPRCDPDEHEGGTWLMSARTGKKLRRLWRHSADTLDWAPDGRSLVASRGSHDTGARLSVIRADGKGAKRVTPHVRGMRKRPHDGELAAAWSPDGQRIAFIHERDNTNKYGDIIDEIWTMSPRGTRADRISTHNAGNEEIGDFLQRALTWQPLAR